MVAKKRSGKPAKAFQISFPSMDHVRKMVEAMVEQTNNRREFHNGKFTKQTFYNSVLLGLNDIDAKDDLDVQEVAKKGLLAVVVDRGASILSHTITADDEMAERLGVRVGRPGRDDAEGRPAPTPPWRMLDIPLDFLDGLDPGLGRAHRKDQAALGD